MAVKVQKKDGRLEDFDRSKVLAGVMRAGVTAEEAESLAKRIETWIQSAAVDGVVHSAAIRNKVLEILRTINPSAASSFGAYKKSELAEGN